MNERDSASSQLEKLSRLTDGQLMDLFYAGDAAALNELSMRHRDRLVQTIRRQLPGSFPARWHAAEDLVAQVFLKVVATRDRPHARWQAKRGEVMTWIGRILHNEIANLLRPRKNWQGTCRNSTLCDAHAGRFTYRNCALKPENRGQRIGKVSNAIQGLPSELREILIMKYEHGRTQAEMSSQLGISKASVAGRLELAREALRCAFQRD